MKTTRKEYLAKFAELRAFNNIARESERESKNCKGDFDWSEYFSAKKSAEDIQNNYFDKLPKVNVTFSIGYRDYAREVVKIGKSYFDRGEVMTKGNGFTHIEEVPEITQKMVDDMISDSYYY